MSVKMKCPYSKRTTTTTNPVTGIVTVTEEPVFMDCLGKECPYFNYYAVFAKDACVKVKDEYTKKGWE